MYIHKNRKLPDEVCEFIRRHHVDPSVINEATKLAARKSGINKKISAHTFRH